MPRRQLGPGGPDVPLFSLGSWNTWDRMTEGEAVAIIRRAHAAGCAFFDVAYYNMGPHAEQSKTDLLFAKAIKASGLSRDQFSVCGKLWLWDYPELNFAGQAKVSLERAGLDRFDTIVVGDYRGQPDMGKIVREVNALIAEGVVSSWGINNWVLSDTLAAIGFAKQHGLVPPGFAQLKYSIVRRSMAEGEGYSALFASGSLALQASDCLEGGILAGKGLPGRKIGADIGGIREQILAVAPRIREIALRYGATPVQACLAFCLANPHTANVLFGVSRMEQLEDNLGALALFEEHGTQLRADFEPLWLDAHVSPDGD